VVPSSEKGGQGSVGWRFSRWGGLGGLARRYAVRIVE
jgi:hypothetical protein